MLKSHKAIINTIRKSRFAGFFAFVLLTGCTEAPSQDALIARAQTEPAIAASLARQRLANSELDSALHFFQLAAAAGDNASLTHALALHQRLHGRLNTAAWLQQQWQSGRFSSDMVSAEQRAELGLWQGDHPNVAAYQAAAGCQITLQPVISQQQGAERWQQLRQAWQQDEQLSRLPVCFNALHVVNSTTLNCTEQRDSRIRCTYTALQPLVAKADFSQLLVIAGRGGASYNNGILQLPDNASLALLRHEFMHILGFIDEYRLARTTAIEVCQPDKVYPNLVIEHRLEQYLTHWPLAEGVTLTEVDTCNAINLQAYRIIAEDNLMQYYELGFPQTYFNLAQQILTQPEKLMPVQYYFAYLARQQQDWPMWQYFMQQAADWGYADASKALAP